MPATTNPSAQGVQELLDKLRDEGVAEGKSQADRLVADARVQAMEILDRAKAEAVKRRNLSPVVKRRSGWPAAT
jgi:V/A-type H+/Na+-transporting ATPase subunit E